MTRPKPIANDRLVSEEGVLHSGLAMVTGFLLPLAPADLFHSQNCTIASTSKLRKNPVRERPIGWYTVDRG